MIFITFLIIAIAYQTSVHSMYVPKDIVSIIN